VAQCIPQKSVQYALKFVRRAVMNVPNIKWSIVSNAPKPAINALTNAGKWQRNNNDRPLPDVQLVLPAYSYADGVANRMFCRAKQKRRRYERFCEKH